MNFLYKIIFKKIKETLLKTCNFAAGVPPRNELPAAVLWFERADSGYYLLVSAQERVCLPKFVR